MTLYEEKQKIEVDLLKAEVKQKEAAIARLQSEIQLIKYQISHGK